MKKFLKTLGVCLGTIILNQFIIIAIFNIGAIFMGDTNKIQQNLFTLVCIGNIVTIAIIYLLYSNSTRKLLNRDVYRKIDLKSIGNIILLGIGLSVIILILTSILTSIFPSYLHVQNQLQSTKSSILQLLIVIVIIPICEEILYRRIIFDYLRKNYNIISAIIIQALIFGIAHGNIVQGIYAFILGIPLALLYMEFNSLWSNTILHIVINLLGVLIIPTIVSINPLLSYVVILIGIICFVVSILKFIKKYEYSLY